MDGVMPDESKLIFEGDNLNGTITIKEGLIKVSIPGLSEAIGKIELYFTPTDALVFAQHLNEASYRAIRELKEKDNGQPFQ